MYNSENGLFVGHVGKGPLQYRVPARKPQAIYPFLHSPYPEITGTTPVTRYFGPYYGVTPGYIPPYVGYRGVVHKGRILGIDEVYEPTLRPFPKFNVVEDCERLNKAMKGYGVDEKAIIDVFAHRSVDQRLRIIEHYKVMYNKDLVKEFRNELSGHFFETIEAMCQPPEDYDAMELRKAIHGVGSDEDTLIEILTTRSNAQIKLIREAYRRLFFGRDLESDIRNDTSGHFKSYLISQLQPTRDESQTVDRALAQKDAQKLFDAGEKRLASTQSQLNAILCSRSATHLRFVFDAYARLANRDIEIGLQQALTGDLLRSYLALIRCIRNKPSYFAGRLQKAMKGLGTNDGMLIRIVVTRCEVDMGRIKHEFYVENRKTLARWISDDTSGDYRRLLLALINEDKGVE
ncbi:unnamed protein product [Echinostoma caproni]|uniref:Annexin n=1 Tax=Echinostoma caproni TaxID=27848 RepID=A0A183A991_9TREM|nr:unnamed protein product [Echinostoma caproni]